MRWRGMGLWLFPDDDYAEVATKKVTGSLDQFGCWGASWTAPTSGGISQARRRLGRDALAEVFEQVVEPVGSMLMRGAMLRSWRTLAIDGFEVDVPGTEANAADAGSGDNRSEYPNARVVAATERTSGG